MNFQNLNDTQKATIFIVVGLILLFYSLGIFKAALHLIILLGSLALILYGVILGDVLPKIKALFQRKK